MQNKNAHTLALSDELLIDIELSRLKGKALVQKAARLARLTGVEEISGW